MWAHERVPEEDKDKWHCCQECSEFDEEDIVKYKAEKPPDDAKVCSECEDCIDDAGCTPLTKAG